jgi:hypothetical protein
VQPKKQKPQPAPLWVPVPEPDQRVPDDQPKPAAVQPVVKAEPKKEQTAEPDKVTSDHLKQFRKSVGELDHYIEYEGGQPMTIPHIYQNMRDAGSKITPDEFKAMLHELDDKDEINLRGINEVGKIPDKHKHLVPTREVTRSGGVKDKDHFYWITKRPGWGKGGDK